MLVGQINSDNYAAAAVRTEASYAGARERLKNMAVLLVLGDMLLRSISAGDRQDEFKKFVFYGKQNALGLLAPDTGLIDEQNPVYERLTSDPRVLRLLHAFIGLQTETAELQRVLADYLFSGKPIDFVNVSEELGDTSWYVGIGADTLDTTMTQIFTQNIQKLAKRYGDKFTEFAAIHRDLDAEQQVLKQYQTPPYTPAAADLTV